MNATDPSVPSKSSSSTKTTWRLTLDVDERLHKRIRVACAQDGRRMSDVLRDILEERFPAW